MTEDCLLKSRHKCRAFGGIFAALELPTEDCRLPTEDCYLNDALISSNASNPGISKV